MKCKCGETKCLECSLECPICHDTIENYPDLKIACRLAPSLKFNDDDIVVLTDSKGREIHPKCPKCGKGLIDMTGREKTNFFDTGRCC